MDNEHKTLYESDFYHWKEQQKKHLLNRDFDRLDIEHLIEEVDDMGSELDTLESRLTTLLLHLLKYEYQVRVLNPNLPEPYNCRDWLATIDRTRLAIRKLIKKRPHLQSLLESAFQEAYPDGKLLAIKEMNRYVLKYQMLDHTSFPETCPWTTDQVMEDNWLPH
ncbi:DUF29 domain-containing protein [Endozoicomonas gorgoniicola]|uniref:DUF29 domain-containing protein n=1 Tax=Endozoicomonas gorgoniicola TaxID=1234144 RepID=A0ABT3N2J1_9GAMM|nr:DUF29 domain-containing protein [Endozoicomonas gorgoniicola]MCW7555845.1 DUF29 domain-containing protein [Endozoicomonas gorgoniicola]